MDCPQCGAEVPSGDSFCGKCGYAQRDHAPERLDQSRIRVHETPNPSADDRPGRSSSQQRVRKHTVLGMPTGTPPAATPPTPAPIPSPPPTSISSARAGRPHGRTPQKTMLGIQPPDLVAPPSEPPAEMKQAAPPAGEEGVEPESAAPSHRARARVRYDSANEPLPVTQRRRKALRGLALLALVAAAWLGYRYLTLHG